MFKNILFLTALLYADVIQANALVKPPAVRCRYPNEEYAIDPDRPQNTCDAYGCYKQLTCPGSSQNGDCYCKEGYARLIILDNFKGPCIPVTNPYCAKKLPPTKEDCAKRKNEVWHDFASNYKCGNTCEDYGIPCYQLLPVWSPHCECKDGFARLPNGECVSIDDPRCYGLYMPSEENCKRRGEIFSSISACSAEASCEFPNGHPGIPGMMCPAVMVEACVCPQGYLRNALYKCVPKSQCD